MKALKTLKFLFVKKLPLEKIFVKSTILISKLIHFQSNIVKDVLFIDLQELFIAINAMYVQKDLIIIVLGLESASEKEIIECSILF